MKALETFPRFGRLLRHLRRPVPKRPSSDGLARPDAARFVVRPENLCPGNVVDLMVNGEEAFPAMLEAIDRAQHFVHLETYILVDDDTGSAFASALTRATRRGVAVRLMFDSVGSVTLPPEFVTALTESGVEVVEFRPLRRYLFSKYLARRDHRKILVVDGDTGFTGGLNVSDDYISTPERPGWRDTHARVRGPAVAQLAAAFERTWIEAGGAPFSLETRDHDVEVARDGGAMWSSVLVSDGVDRPAIRQQYLHAIDLAERHIAINNAYFVPDRRLVSALENAAVRGVDVDIIVPERSDVPIVQAACEYLFERLMRAGIRVYYWQHTHMHAKTAVIDGVWSVVGSYNLDGMSHFRNKEVILQVVDEDFAARMTRQFEIDRESCDALEPTRWSRRPLRRRIAEWACYRFRDWL